MEVNFKSGFLRARPTCEHKSSLLPCQVIDAIQENLMEDKKLRGETLGNYATIQMAGENKAIWSPVLSIHAVKRGEGAIIKGTMGPDPKLWSVCTILYIISIAFFFVGLLMFIYQVMFGIESKAVWGMPVGVIVAMIIFLMAKIGRYKAKNQVDYLWRFLEDSIERKEKGLDKS